MAQIELLNVTKKFDDVVALDNINLEIERGEVIVEGEKLSDMLSAKMLWHKSSLILKRQKHM